MSILLQINPYEFFADLKGDALDEGYIYIGEPNKDPRSFPVPVYYDQALTIPAVQPLRTLNGYVVRNNTPTFLFLNGNYSIAVYDKKRRLVYTVADFLMIGNSAAVSASDLASTSDDAKGDALVGVKQPGANSVARTQHTQNAEFLTVAAYASAADAVVAGFNKRLFVGPGQNLTVSVPTHFASVDLAFSAIRDWIILQGGSVTIQVAPGTYVPTAETNFNHPFGDRITILGDTTTPSNCKIRPAALPTFDCFTVTNGHIITIKGFRFELPSKAPQANNWTAVLALRGATAIVEDCECDNWYYSFAERSGAMMYTLRCKASNAGDVAFWAFCGGTLKADNCQVLSAFDVANSLGFGYQGEFGGVVEATSCTATGCREGGFAALSNGVGRYYSCTANANTGGTGAGFFARSGGKIEANGSTASNNNYRVFVTEDGGVYNGPIDGGGNVNDVNAFAFLAQAGGQAQVASATGPLRVDAAGNSVFFNTAGGLQAEIANMAAAVNHTYMRGGAAGQPVTFGASGSDPTVDLLLSPQGAGSHIQLGAGFFAGAPAATGYIEVKDNTGTVRKVLVG